MDDSIKDVNAGRTCRICKRFRMIDAFNFKNKARGIRHIYCRDCTRRQLSRHYDANHAYSIKKARKRNRELAVEQRQLMLAYLAGHPCVDCGEPDPVCLEFDHVRGAKRSAIAAMLGNHCWETILTEIAKCDVRCANCHRRKTARDRGWYRVFANERP